LGGVERESGIQVTPDEKRVLISKDVEGERWAITRNTDDLTVTGNVFFPEGGDPLFLFCEQTADDGDDLTFDCFGADKCVESPCGGDDFEFIAEVTLPESFFLPPGAAGTPTPSPTSTGGGPTPGPTSTGGSATCGNGVAEGDEECDGADLDGQDCESLVGGADECTAGAPTCNDQCRLVATSCTCPCEEDFDCDLEVDCTAVVEECELFGVCEGGSCVTNPIGTPALCNGSDPGDPEVPRCEE
jgi:hypothetical protein